MLVTGEKRGGSNEISKSSSEPRFFGTRLAGAETAAGPGGFQGVRERGRTEATRRGLQNVAAVFERAMFHRSLLHRRPAAPLLLLAPIVLSRMRSRSERPLVRPP